MTWTGQETVTSIFAGELAKAGWELSDHANYCHGKTRLTIQEEKHFPIEGWTPGYTVDICIEVESPTGSRRIAIEVDGPTHYDSDRVDSDKRRDRVLYLRTGVVTLRIPHADLGQANTTLFLRELAQTLK